MAPTAAVIREPRSRGKTALGVPGCVAGGFDDSCMAISEMGYG